VLPAINNTYEYCAPTASACPKEELADGELRSQQHAELGASSLTVTDSAGRVTRYSNYGNFNYLRYQNALERPADNITYTFCGSGGGGWCSASLLNCGQGGYPYQTYVTSVTSNGHIWTYSGTPGSPGYYQCGTATYGFYEPVGSGKQVNVPLRAEHVSGGGTRPGFDPFQQLTDEDGVVFQGSSQGSGL